MCRSNSSVLNCAPTPLTLLHGHGGQAAYERSFGPFYRIEQLILSTRPTARDQPAPPIVTPDGLELLFAMQDRVDGLTGERGCREQGFQGV